ncbi:MAG: nucleoside hydrolase [Candidatus Glassbacteria bacterium]
MARLSPLPGWPALIFYVLFLSGNPAGMAAQSPGQSDRIKIIIDTDIGEDIDDILVTAFALNSPEFEILAITVVDGDVAARSRITRKLTQLYGRPDIPVAAGYVWDMPLPDYPPWPGSGGLTQRELAPAEEGLPAGSQFRADELIARLADKYPDQVYLVTFGSMTNVGQLLVRFPQQAARLKGIVTSHNLEVDPVAAAITLRSEVPWVFLSARNISPAVTVGPAEVERIRRAGLPSADYLARAIDLWYENKPDHSQYPHLADLCALAYLLGGWFPTYRGNFSITVPTRLYRTEYKRIEWSIEENPDGRVTFGREMTAEKGAELNALFMERILASPAARKDKR